MYHPELQSYVTGSRAAGVSDEQIKTSLLASGWAEADVAAALAGMAVPTPGGGLQVTSAGRRLVNYIIDGIILYVLFSVPLMILSNSIVEEGGAGVQYLGLWQISFLLILLGYYLLFEGLWQRTPGKFATGTKVVMRDGAKPDFLHILGRTFARMIPFEPFSFLGGAPGWHDTLSKTLVVPKDYTPEQVQQIDIKKKTSGSGWVVGIVIGVVAITLIGILAAVVLVSLNSARGKARDAQRITDVRQIQTSLELYYSDKAAYPAALDDLVTGGYIDTLPTAPLPPDGECSAEENYYYYESNATDYALAFCLGSETSGYGPGRNAASSVADIDTNLSN